MSNAAHLDTETRSAADLRKVGADRYFEHPTTEIVCLAWRIESYPLGHWRPGDPDPVELLDHIRAGRRVVAHNYGFDMRAWNTSAPAHWPRLSIEQGDCTMARAAVLGLPQSLEQCGAALGLSVQKDVEGRRLMMQMCRPRTLEPLTWWEDDDRIARLQTYCGSDVCAEEPIDATLPALSVSERRLWELDTRINRRGFSVDLELCRRADGIVADAKSRADQRIWRYTGGAVRRCTETARIISWISAQGVPCTSIAKGEIEELVIGAQLQGSQVAEDVIRLRRAAARTSTAKFSSIIDTACADGRVRGSLAYHGASTGRWAGRLVQPQNFPRVDPDRDGDNVQTALDLMRAGEGCDALELIGEPMELLSKCLRAMIIAPPGRKLVNGDLANIEGRVNAWLAGEAWKLQAFRDYDAGIGPDLYKVTAARILGKTVDAVSSSERQAQGKVAELSAGYQGSVGAFVSMAANYGTPVHELADIALRTATADDLMRAREQWTPQMGHGLPVDTWVAIKTIVNGWRDANPQIVKSWWELQDAAIEAVGAPGTVVPCLGGRVAYQVRKGFLWCQLPSKRLLAYAAPRLRWSETEDAEGKIRRRLQVEYDAVNSKTKRWGPHRLYGGLQCENIVQAVSRDILVEGMFAVEDAGYQIVLTVHDEVLSEVDAGFGSAAEFEALMTKLSSAYDGLPVSAKAWEDVRYVK